MVIAVEDGLVAEGDSLTQPLRAVGMLRKGSFSVVVGNDEE